MQTTKLPQTNRLTNFFRRTESKEIDNMYPPFRFALNLGVGIFYIGLAIGLYYVGAFIYKAQLLIPEEESLNVLYPEIGKIYQLTSSKELDISEKSDVVQNEQKIIAAENLKNAVDMNSDMSLSISVSADQCMALIDNKEANFENASLTVNGQLLPLDVISSHHVALNENHKLCNQKNNLVNVNFDNVYSKNKEFEAQPLTVLQKKLIDINSQAVNLQTQALKYSTRSTIDIEKRKALIQLVDILKNKAQTVQQLIDKK